MKKKLFYIFYSLYLLLIPIGMMITLYYHQELDREQWILLITVMVLGATASFINFYYNILPLFKRK